MINGVIYGVIRRRIRSQKIRKSENQRRYAHNYEDDRRGQLVLDSGAVASSSLVYVLRSRSHEVLGPVLEFNPIILQHALCPTRLSSV